MKWYSSENDISDLNVDNLRSSNDEIPLDKTKVNLIKDIFNNLEKGLPSRCLSIYRDVILHEGTRINLCLSCGDIMVNGKVTYLSDRDLQVLKNIKHGREN